LQKIYDLNTKDLTSNFYKHKPSPPLAEAYRWIESQKPAEIVPIKVISMDMHSYFQPCFVTYTSYQDNPSFDSMLHRSITNNLNGFNIIYTDGSKGPDGCGCAFYDKTGNYQRLFKLNKFNSIYTAEAFAINESLKYCSEKQISRVAIMSDSLSVLQSLQSRKNIKKTNSIIVDCIEMVSKMLQRGGTVRFFWVKAHSGITGNNIVDELAKRSVTEGQEVESFITRDEIVSFSKREIGTSTWNQLWKKSYTTKTTQYAILHPTVNSSLWYKNSIITRRFYSTIVRLKFGHARFPAHLYKIKVIESPSCRCGVEYGDLDHIFFECPLNEPQTEYLVSALVTKGIPLPTSILALLATEQYDVYRLIFGFVQSANISL